MNYIGVVLICGIPGVGKSTLAKKLYEENKGNVILLEFDKIEKVDKSNFIDFQLMRDDYLNIFKSELYKTIIKGEDDSKNKWIVLDDNFYMKSMRKKFYQETCKYLMEHKEEVKMTYCEIFLHCDCSIAIAMNNQREKAKQIPNEVIEKMFQEFEYNSPYIIKEKEQLCYHHNDIKTELSLDALITFIKKADLLPYLIEETPIEEQHQKKDNAIFIDDLELLLRKGIAIKIKEAKTMTGKDISLLKKSFMKTVTQLLSNTPITSLSDNFSMKDISEILETTIANNSSVNKVSLLTEYFLNLIK